MRTLDLGGLFERYRPDVFRFALYLTGNRADAEDVASETFARAKRAVRQGGATSRKPWLTALLPPVMRIPPYRVANKKRM